MTEYVHVGRHADALASGRHIGPGDRVSDTDLDPNGDRVLLDEGVLVSVSSFGGPSNQQTRDELQKRAAELGIEGRSGLKVDELRQAVIDAEAGKESPNAA